ncbi:permease-like cell division protein FtsX [Paenibacillus endoradicis]|uniref:permease-like cell division protein FtsX n=1 Tax=Paenibacillus endoradicis TaxID=2972487 RepID=UPI002158DFE9|nr:permease-like cell division protein FtsX [Paenibacillus endoradicis]MCR8660565.1 permease-like cell division protein FtsX [Paenibacillus endoradicis]
MKLSTATRHIREGFKSIIRNGWMSFASISSIFISLFILGVFILLALNMNYMASQIESQVQIRVYFETDASEEVVTELQNKIGNISEVSKLTYVSKEDGLAILRDKMGEDNSDWLEGYDDENNPLPISFTIEVFNPQLVDTVAQQINIINNAFDPKPIKEVKYGQDTVETLFKITNAIRNAGFAIVIALAVTAMLLISNTIKMTIVARRREIEIMKLVGATNAFIRWPFFIEGALIGIISSIVTTIIILLGYDQVVHAFQYDLSLMLIQLLPLEKVITLTATTMITLGSLIGIWGSVMSVRKYLKV